MAYPVDFERKKQIAQAYGWDIFSWPSEPVSDSMVMMSRWEDADGNVVAAPPTVECDPPKPGVRQHVIVNGEPHQTFFRLPYYGPARLWEDLLWEHLIRHRLAWHREGG